MPTGKVNPKAASLDRIDSKRGYTEGNVQWVHKSVNLAKNSLSEVEFIMLCHAVTNHRRSEGCM